MRHLVCVEFPLDEHGSMEESVFSILSGIIDVQPKGHFLPWRSGVEHISVISVSPPFQGGALYLPSLMTELS